MKNVLIISLAVLVSVATGIWLNQNLQVRYVIEEYYLVQNLDPNNEKDAELLRQQIQKLIQKTIPSRFQPEPERFQCFKIISEAVFFCTMDTYRKHVAEYVKKLLQETVPQEIGWMTLQDATRNYENLKAEIDSNKKLVLALNHQLEKTQKQDSKQQAEGKKFAKTNDLYKKNLDLLQKKNELLRSLIEQPLEPDIRSEYQLQAEETQASLAMLVDEVKFFREQNQKFAEIAEHRETLGQEIAEMKEKNAKEEEDLSFMEDTLSEPNAVGKIANVTEQQLIPDKSREKFEPQRKPTNAIWFTLVTFFLLTNFILRFQPRAPVSFQEDGTMTEALIK